MKYLAFLTICFYSCAQVSSPEDQKFVQRFSDGFYTINPYWETAETNDISRYGIVPDPVNEENNALVFHLFPNDFFQGKKRNELILRTKDTIGYEAHYSFKFLFPAEFFSEEKELDWIMIQQWHDEPDRGLLWGDYKMDTTPPVHLFIKVHPGGKFDIVYAYGLWNKNQNKIRYITFESPLQPNIWYTFDNTVRWSMDDSGFSVPMINGENLIKEEENSDGKIFGANMFNDVPNYYKMGLYGNYKGNDSISVYFDDFNYVLYSPE